MTASLINRLRKIRALAESGVAGEAENARDLLARLLHENNLTAVDLLTEIIESKLFQKHMRRWVEDLLEDGDHKEKLANVVKQAGNC